MPFGDEGGWSGPQDVAGGEEALEGTDDQLRERLVELGVEPALAAIYLLLLDGGPATAADVAARLDANRPTVYKWLETLVGEGFASASLTRPLMFVPAEPHKVLDIMRRRCLLRAAAWTAALQELEPLLNNLATHATASHGLPFRIINGRQRAYENMHDLLDHATSRFYVVNSHAAAAQLADQTGLWRRVRQRAEAGLDVRVVLPDSPVSVRYAQRNGGPNCEVRLAALDAAVRFAIADSCKMLFFASMDPSPWISANDAAVLTEVPGLVEAQKVLFDSLWDEARPA